MVSVLVFAVTGYGWAAVSGFLDGVTQVDVLSKGAGGDLPSDGSRDILLVGMDSRTDAQGNPLPQEMLKKLTAGTASGELNTDTLIMLHIPNDGSKAVAISMPRDSYVKVPGYGKHKINSAYGRAKFDAEQQLRQQGVKDPQQLEVKSNEAGARTLIETVETLTGRTIDNYASINLLGFYQITKAVGGVEVCLKQPAHDPLSGANFPAGRQTLAGAKALAFVRQRHGLLRGDIDRVRRQQAFMASLAHKVISAGTLTNPAKFSALKDAIEKSVVLNQGWDIVDFAKQMSDLTGGQIEFRTVPFGNMGLATPDGSAVQVFPYDIKRMIEGLSESVQGPYEVSAQQAKANSKITVSVLNAAGVDGMAGDVSEQLTMAGFGEGKVANALPLTETVIRYAPGDMATAKRVASNLEGPSTYEVDSSLSKGSVTVLLGDDYPPPGTVGGGATPAGLLAAPAKPEPKQPEDDLPAGTITADGVTCVN